MILIYKSPRCFLPSFKSIHLSVQEKKWKNRFLRWPPRQPFWISDWKDFSYFWSTSPPDACYQVSSQLAFRFRRRRERDLSPDRIACLNLRLSIKYKNYDLKTLIIVSVVGVGVSRCVCVWGGGGAEGSWGGELGWGVEGEGRTWYWI